MTKRNSKLRVMQLAAVIFFTVSGGPYGIEPLFSFAGAHGTLILLIISPLLWDIPTILTVLELNGIMPLNGGYYQWVKNALGLRWGFFEGYWTWLYTFVDLAIYPVLFVEYVSFFFPQLQGHKLAVCLCIVWASALLNIIGIVPVGRISMVLGAIVLAPFFMLWVQVFLQHGHAFSVPQPSLRGLSFPAIGMGLYTVMWNFFGWDNATTYAEEVDKPVRSYIISCGVAFLTIFAMYIVTAIVVINTGIDFSLLGAQGFPFLGTFTGNRWLASLLSIGGMASAVGLFTAVLLSVSRVPKVMADDGLMPKWLNALHPRYKTPYVSIIVSAAIVSVMCLFSFTDLIIMDVTLYGAGLFLEFVSLLVLRVREPQRRRPYKIPLSVPGLSIMFFLSFVIYATGLSGAFLQSDKTFFAALGAVVALFSGEIIWRIIIWRKPELASVTIKSKDIES